MTSIAYAVSDPVAVVYRVDDVVVRRSFRTAADGIRFWELMAGDYIYTHWVVLRDRITGATMSWRARDDWKGRGTEYQPQHQIWG